MKLTKCDKGIHLSNLPKTIIGIICAIAYPVFYIITAYDVFANRFVDIDWFDIFTLIIILPAYILWLIKDFRTSIIRYRITIDKNGIRNIACFQKTKNCPGLKSVNIYVNQHLRRIKQAKISSK